MTTPYNPENDGAQMSFDGRMSYGDYLNLNAILSAQHPQSDAHDEMLFIVQHQTSELWMRLAIHELTAARDCLLSGQVRPAFKMLARVGRIFEQLNSAWDVLRTMTPSDYTTFREALGQSSGFQSHQYRLIEFILGPMWVWLGFGERPSNLVLIGGGLVLTAVAGRAFAMIRKKAGQI